MQFLCKPVTLWNVFIGMRFIDCEIPYGFFFLISSYLPEDVSLALRLYGTIPTIVFELIATMTQRKKFCFAKYFRQARILLTLMILFARPFEIFTRT
jgi:F0F1-type ATP synthase membrane subunit a